MTGTAPVVEHGRTALGERAFGLDGGRRAAPCGDRERRVLCRSRAGDEQSDDADAFHARVPREYFIPERFRGWALPGDTVEIRRLPPKPMGRRGPGRPKGPELNDAAAVVRVIKR